MQKKVQEIFLWLQCTDQQNQFIEVLINECTDSQLLGNSMLTCFNP
jgi:hypothetical protein